MHRVRLLIAAILAVAMVIGATAPAGAQEYVQNPYTGQWLACDYYPNESGYYTYWCQWPDGSWTRTNPIIATGYGVWGG